MELFDGDPRFARHVAEQLGGEEFRLLDVGCSGGLHPSWRAFGSRLRAWGFDPDAAECARLAALEALPGVTSPLRRLAEAFRR
ncbi:MAG TPA: hypothetical protein VGC80_00900 [Acetobacteraceae bacterium]